MIGRVTDSGHTKHLVRISKLTWQKSMLFACLLVPIWRCHTLPNAPSVSREKKKENFTTVGGIEERAGVVPI